MFMGLLGGGLMAAYVSGCFIETVDIVAEDPGYVTVSQLVVASSLPSDWNKDARAKLLSTQIPIETPSVITAGELKKRIHRRVPGWSLGICIDPDHEFHLTLSDHDVETTDAFVQAKHDRDPGGQLGRGDDMLLKIFSAGVEVTRPVMLLESLKGKSKVFVKTSSDEVLSVPVNGGFMRLEVAQ